MLLINDDDDDDDDDSCCRCSELVKRRIIYDMQLKTKTLCI